MIVSRVRYNRLRNEHLKLQDDHLAVLKEYHTLLHRWNALTAQINKKGGKNFLENGHVGVGVRLNLEDIKRLLLLIHPDKHDGKQIAVEMTQKLLALRG